MTTTITALARDRRGNFVFPRTSDYLYTDIDFTTLSALPAAVTVGGTNGGTGAISGTSPNAVMRLTTGPAAGNQAFFSLPAVDTSKYDLIQFNVEAIAPGSNYPDQIYFGIEGGSNAGGSWRKLEGTVNSRATGDTSIQGGPMLGTTGRTTKRNLGMLILPGKKIIATLHGDQIISAATFSAFVGGSITPKVTVQTNTAAAKTLDFRRVTVKVA